MKKLGALFGFLLGIFSIFGSFILEGGQILTLFIISPMVIVFGGTFAAVIIGFGMEKFLKIFTLIKIAINDKDYDLEKMINLFVDFSITAKSETLLAIEGKLDRVEYLFPKKLIRFTVDGTEREALYDIAQLEMKMMHERHNSNAFIFSKMGGYAPTMGILGTVMGLFLTLTNAAGDPEVLISNIATAFIATLWGVLTANLIWLPIGDKLKECHLKEKHMMEIALEGALSLQSGEIPSITKAKLTSMLPQQTQRRILDV